MSLRLVFRFHRLSKAGNISVINHMWNLRRNSSSSGPDMSDMSEIFKAVNSPMMQKLMKHPEMVKMVETLRNNPDEMNKMKEMLLSKDNIARAASELRKEGFSEKLSKFVDEFGNNTKK